MSITGTSAGSPGYYYFYYDIEIEALCDNTVSSINEIKELTNELIKIFDVLGRKVQPTKNTPLFYQFEDGTVEKKIIVD